MPVPALIALVIAFFLPVELGARWGAPMGGRTQLGLLFSFVLLDVVASFLLGRQLARWIARRGMTSSARRLGSRLTRFSDLMGLLTFAGIILIADWPMFVRGKLGLADWVLLDELLIFLPFPILQCIGWRAFFPAELAVRSWRRIGSPPPTPSRMLMLRLRQNYGLLGPVGGIFAISQDLAYRIDPQGIHAPWTQLVGYGVVSVLIVVFSPALVRLTWPTRSLPAGPLRDRLEGLARRLNFRFSDILLWDTGGGMVNAGVTGAVPWFRYVLLTDGLVENLEARQVEAVFGHEIGHIAHRHLSYFATFFLGSFGVMALLMLGVDSLLTVGGPLWYGPANQRVESIVQSLAAILGVIAYFALVFGFLSRRFERQADVFGCRAVSCGRESCPPHLDINLLPPAIGVNRGLCPVGIRIFVDALMTVALLNGIEPTARSWRHGSIAHRIAFLEGLEDQPDRERSFQRGLRSFRVALLAVLGVALVVAYWTGALDRL